MGLFIAFEGPDGSGKSTQARLLADALRLLGHEVAETREPGGTPIGERLRTLILDPDSPPATPLVMALMLSAARAQLITDVVTPALSAGKIVIADRYADSTAAYQGAALGLPRDTVDALRRVATGGLDPDVVVYVDIEPEVGAARVIRRGAENRLDRNDLAFHRRVREGYRGLIDEAPDRWISVAGNRPADAVHADIMEQLLPRLAARRLT